MNGELNFSSMSACKRKSTCEILWIEIFSLQSSKKLKEFQEKKMLCLSSTSSIKKNVSGFSKTNNYNLILIAFYGQRFSVLMALTKLPGLLLEEIDLC